MIFYDCSFMCGKKIIVGAHPILFVFLTFNRLVFVERGADL